MPPAVSLVVPYYGVEDYIDECLATIRDQTFADFECVLVDDGSVDGSRAVAERYVAADPRFRIVTQPNAGLGAARNTGLAHCSGDYLMFIDSDDLLAPRALEQLVTTLGRTGSDFAGGNVWRLSPTWGLFVSQAHAEQFAEHRERVTIADVPLLMRDRMIWNKLYRRSFWDAHGYRFPEMRFEDYPVTLLAHLDAHAVDLLPDPIYVWREREAGTSISQQGFDIANVRDRVRAVHMVLDFVDARASETVQALVDSYFVQVDLKETMLSLRSVRADDQDELERLIASVADRIQPGRVHAAPPFNQLFYRAARDRDWDLCRALSSWAGGEGVAGMRRHLAGSRRLSRARAEAATLAARKRIPQLGGVRALKSALVAFERRSDALSATLNVKLRPQIAQVARAVVWANGTRLPASMTRVATGLQLQLDIPQDASACRTVRIQVGAGPLRWEGPIDVDAAPPIERLGATWLQVTAHDGHLGFEAPSEPVVMTHAAIADGVIEIFLSCVVDELVIRRPYPDAPLIVDVAADEARLSLGQLVDGDPADNPVTRIAARPVRATVAGTQRPIYLATGGFAGVDPASGRRITLAADQAGHLLLTHEQAQEA